MNERTMFLYNQMNAQLENDQEKNTGFPETEAHIPVEIFNRNLPDGIRPDMVDALRLYEADYQQAVMGCLANITLNALVGNPEYSGGVLYARVDSFAEIRASIEITPIEDGLRSIELDMEPRVELATNKVHEDYCSTIKTKLDDQLKLNCILLEEAGIFGDSTVDRRAGER